MSYLNALSINSNCLPQEHKIFTIIHWNAGSELKSWNGAICELSVLISIYVEYITMVKAFRTRKHY
jgi:hypothetical protein